MAWLITKWVLGVGVILVGLGAILTNKVFHVEIFIPAPQETIWAVLMNTSDYPEWNPVFTKVEGTYAVGNETKNFVRDPSGAILEMSAEITALIPGEELRQKGGMPGALTFDHRWLLEPVEGGTKVTQHEIDRGIGLWFWDSSWIEPAYSKVNEALKVKTLEMLAVNNQDSNE